MHFTKQGPKRRRFTRRDLRSRASNRFRHRWDEDGFWETVSTDHWIKWQRRNEPQIEEWGDPLMWIDGVPIDMDADDDDLGRYYDELEELEILEEHCGFVEQTRFGIFGSISTPVYRRPERCTFGGRPCEHHGYTHMIGGDDIVDEPFEEEYPVEDHDLDYGSYDFRDDYYNYWYEDDERYRREEDRKFQEEQAWQEIRPPYWIVDEQVDLAYEEVQPSGESEEAQFEAAVLIRLYMEGGEDALNMSDAEIDKGWALLMRQNLAWRRDHILYGMHPIK